MTDQRLQDLVDRADIDDAINAYSHALDQREWSLLDEAFLPDAEIVLIDASVTHTPRSLVTALSRNDATRLSGQHLVGKTRARVTGDVAHAVTEALWTTLQTTEDPTAFLLVRGTGVYVDDLRRVDAGWRITRPELALKSISRDLVPLEEGDLEKIRFTLGKEWFSQHPVDPERA